RPGGRQPAPLPGGAAAARQPGRLRRASRGRPPEAAARHPSAEPGADRRHPQPPGQRPAQPLAPRAAAARAAPPPRRVPLLRPLRPLPADFVLLDLGAGLHPAVMDYFMVGENGVVVISPEP